MNKMDYRALGLSDSLIEAIKKCDCKKESAYNPTCSMDDLKSEPNGSLPDAMTNKINIADEKKKKTKAECAMDAMTPGYNKSIKS